MKILFTICGRAGSKGIKNKNVRTFLGYSLPYYTLSALDLFLNKKTIDFDYDIVVNTDSEELMDIMRTNPFREVVIVNREKDLSGDLIGKIAVIADCFKKMKSEYDMVVDLDITSPLRTVLDIERVIVKHIEKEPDVTTTVTTSRRNPYFNQVIKTDYGYKKVIDSEFTARQQAPEIFDMNASIYAYSSQFLKMGKGVLDGYVECVEMYDTGILDLDHENDFVLMEIVAKYLFDTNYDFKEIYENIKEHFE